MWLLVGLWCAVSVVALVVLRPSRPLLQAVVDALVTPVWIVWDTVETVVRRVWATRDRRRRGKV